MAIELLTTEAGNPITTEAGAELTTETGAHGVAQSNGQGIAVAVGRGLHIGTGSANGTAVVAGRLFSGFAGFASGFATVRGAGQSVGGGTTTQHIQLLVDGVNVFETGGGLSFIGSSVGQATALGVGKAVRMAAGSAAGQAVAHAQGLLPNQTIALAQGISSAKAGVHKPAVGFAAGVARVGSPLDQLAEIPLTSRGMTALMSAAIQLTVVRPVFLYEGQFKDGTLNLWTGYGEIVWNNKTWTSAGGLLNISTIQETDQQQAQGVILQLSAVPSSQIALALASIQRNMPGQIWLGLTDDGNRLIENPQTMFRGRLDTVSIEDSEDTAIIKASYENEMITLEHAREIRYTDEEQKRLYPTDRGLEFVASIQDLTLRWGSRG
jgi:hypothetical protein